ncbi:MAG: choice-of-anchor D domain-containing protein [Nitrospirota bacterium]
MRKTISLLILVLIIAISGTALAKSTYLDSFNSTYGTAGTVLNTCSVCHTAVPALNPYGTAYKNSGHVFSTIQTLDSDGDGSTNIVEINARTFPGDPTSKPAATDTTAPTITGFSIPSTSSSLTVSITTFTASDNVGVTGYMVKESSTAPTASSTGWSATKPASFTFATAGAKTLYAWVKDAAGNISASRSAAVTITLAPAADTTKPTVTSFSIPSSSTSLTVSITSFTASDNVGVTGYRVTESSAIPTSGWSAAPPTSYTFAAAGTKTLYAWAIDAAGNVSASRSASVTITTSTGGGTGSQHAGNTYNGPATCLACHQAEANEVHGSAHYQWQGPALYMVNGAPLQGKLKTAVNSYCGNIIGNWGGCSSCHVGLGAQPTATVSQSQLENIDCLICHQKDYKRKKDAATGLVVPDTANMTITMDQAVQTVHKPVRSNCLQCHAKGGGGDNNKRGDMAVAHANTSDRNFDVHMATTGANLVCQACHTTQNHKIAGRGSDLRETDIDVKMSCVTSTCHSTKLSSTGHVTVDVNKHVKKVACQTCHIKTYARNAADTAADESTEVIRDWQHPEWVASLNRWEPTITRASNLKPEYKFWNGTSWGYSLNDPASIDPATGRYPTSRPQGGINDANSKLYPFKYKIAVRPYAPSIARLIPVDTKVYFGTGNPDAAVKSALTLMGYSDTVPYTWVEDDTYQLITHEVMPKANALTCNECHTSTATQMNLKQMGYVLKGAESSVCTQCHGQKSNPGYLKVHKIHVTDKKYDCSKCHNFTRSGATTPPPTQGAADISVASTTVDYGKVVLNTTKEKKIKVSNKGTATLNVTKVEISGTNASLFSLGSSSSFTVAPGSSYGLKVRFKPTSTGKKTATVNVYSNDPDTPILSITVKGEGVTSL